MNTEVRDALPDFVNNRLSGLDAVTMREHIESCADCQAEVAILRDVRASAMLAPQIDANRIASAIRPYAVVRPQPVASRRPWLMAATAAIVAIGGFAILNRPAMNSAAPAVAVVTPTTTPATPGESKVATTTPSPAATEKSAPKEVDVASLSLVGSTDDLSDADLDSLVAALDGIESVPSAEPGSVTTTVDDIDGTNDQ
jgi:hypothetical protein